MYILTFILHLLRKCFMKSKRFLKSYNNKNIVRVSYVSKNMSFSFAFTAYIITNIILLHKFITIKCKSKTLLFVQARIFGTSCNMVESNIFFSFTLFNQINE